MDGKVLFMRGWSYFYGTLAAQGPTGDGSAEAAHTDRPEAAQALIEFLTSARSQQILFERGGSPPTREVVCRDDAVTKKYPYGDDVLQGIQRARMRPATPYYNQFSQEFAGAVHEALQKGTPPDEAGLAERLEEALEGG